MTESGGTPTTSEETSLGCADVCGLARPAEDVNASSFSEDDAVTLLNLSQMGVIIVVGVQAMLHIVWAMLDLVPGFALYDGAPGAISAYSHTSWWLVIDFIIILVGAVSVYFGLSYVPAQGAVERSLSRNLGWLTIYMVLLGVNFIALLLHFILSLFEIAHCDSSLCINNEGVLIALLVGLMVDALLNGWGIVRAYSFKRNLENVIGKFDYALRVTKRDTATAAKAMINTHVGARHLHSGYGLRVSLPIQHKMK
jgi:hypothetical protein